MQTQKQISDLNEDIKIADERTHHAIEEREKYSEKNKESIIKIQQLKDLLQDKDIIIEEYEHKLNLTKDQMKIQKVETERMQKKIDQIYDRNILIPKQEKDGEQQHEKEDQNDN